MRRRNDPVFQRFEYIDGITIIDVSGRILFSVKFNRDLVGDQSRLSEIIGMHLLDAFPNLSEHNSTLLNAIKTGRPIYKARQRVTDFTGYTVTTTNCTFPIRSGSRIVGAIEISKGLESKDAITPDEDVEVRLPFDRTVSLIKDRVQADRAAYTLEDILTVNRQMLALKDQVRRIADRKSPVFIVGETGTGKELLAHSIHNEGSYKDEPFISQNCAAIPDSLLESILFGTVKGSFTGATDLPGLFELANGGTLYLDEINSMPLHLQAKLLRVLQDGFVRRVGDTKMRHFEVRIVSSSSRPPSECLRSGCLRPDLFYRLNAISLVIPPLRSRLDDLRLLTDWFVQKHSSIANRRVTGVSAEVFRLFQAYPWPGNVRELEHVIEHAVNTMPDIQDIIETEHLPEYLTNYFSDFSEHCGDEGPILPLRETLELVERQAIRRALKTTGGNVSKAALLLKIPRQTLQSKIVRYDIEPPVPKT